MGNKTVVVIGAVNMDICGRPDKTPRMNDSNPGTVSFGAGGVGRNIAHNLCLLGLDHVSAAAAAITIECPQTVNPELSAELLV